MCCEKVSSARACASFALPRRRGSSTYANVTHRRLSLCLYKEAPSRTSRPILNRFSTLSSLFMAEAGINWDN